MSERQTTEGQTSKKQTSERPARKGKKMTTKTFLEKTIERQTSEMWFRLFFPASSALYKVKKAVLFPLQLETHVDVKKLPPPSFHNVPTMTEGLPSLPGESVV